MALATHVVFGKAMKMTPNSNGGTGSVEDTRHCIVLEFPFLGIYSGFFSLVPNTENCFEPEG